MGSFYDNAFHVHVNTGLRPGELFALLPSDVHLDEGYIDINKITSSLNTPIEVQMYNDAITSVVKSVNYRRGMLDVMDYFTGHTFRHTFATRCFEAGIQPKVVQKYLGHATLQMTMDLYTHVTDELAQEDIEKISLADI